MEENRDEPIVKTLWLGYGVVVIACARFCDLHGIWEGFSILLGPDGREMDGLKADFPAMGRAEVVMAVETGAEMLREKYDASPIKIIATMVGEMLGHSAEEPPDFADHIRNEIIRIEATKKAEQGPGNGESWFN